MQEYPDTPFERNRKKKKEEENNISNRVNSMNSVQHKAQIGPKESTLYYHSLLDELNYHHICKGISCCNNTNVLFGLKQLSRTEKTSSQFRNLKY